MPAAPHPGGLFNADKLRPDSVTIELYADGEDTGKIVTLSEDNNWTDAFEDLAAYTYDGDGNATEITYSISEADVPDGYVLDSTPHTVQLTSSLSSSADSPYVLTISNTAETAVLSAEVESAEVEAAEIVATEGEAGSVLAETREGVASTGDDSNVMFWLILLLAACAALGGVTVLARKRRGV